MAKQRLFSKRNRSHPNRLSTEVSEDFKKRLVHALGVFVKNDPDEIDQLLDELSHFLLIEYGVLNAPAYVAASVSSIPVINHFFYSDRAQSLDFVEALFQQKSCTQGQSAVDYVNELFEDCFLAYRLSDYVEIKIPKGKFRNKVEIEYPTIIPISDETSYINNIRPALALLSAAHFATANRELLDAFSCCKTGHYDESITKSCAAYESFIKSVCSLHGLNYDPNRDTCSRLVKHLIDAGYLPSWYTPCLESVGTIRNKIGSAHGKGPSPQKLPGRHHAEHQFNIVCAHIQLIHEAQSSS